MRPKFEFTLVLAALLLTAGNADAATTQTQMVLNPVMIPQFVEPLPLLEFEFINATSMSLPAAFGGEGLNTASFFINAYEFRSQILPSPGFFDAVPGGPAAIAACGGGADTASFTYGYRSAGPPEGTQTTYLGPVIISERGVAVKPVYGNKLPMWPDGVVQINLPIDQTLDWADPRGDTGPLGCEPVLNQLTGLLEYTKPLCGEIPFTGPMPIATHLHGGEMPPAFDGGPDAWFTQDGPDQITGPGFPGAQYNYPNNQQESTIWFHDHALGITRLNVYAGLAGIMPIIDPANPPVTPLPQLADGYDIPLIIQDRSFDTNCEIFYNLASNPQPNPTVHPFWIPEFIGDTIVVNGKTWPYLDVEPRQYRFRLLNGSNARFYDLSMNKGVKFLAIATDDGYLMNAALTPNIVIGPGERYEVVVDFSKLKKGTKVTMFNAARTPFPGGAAPTMGLTDTVMQFRVVLDKSGVTDTAVAAGSPLRDPDTNPIQPIANAHVAMLPPPNAPVGNITRQLTLNEVIGPGGPLELVVNNSKFNLTLNTPGCPPGAPECRETELPAVSDTEIWEIINITADAHPMHTHLISFQVLDRTPFQAAPWINQYDALLLANGVLPGEGPPNPYNVLNADGAIGGNPAIGPYLQLNKRRLPLPSEMGWKDTVITYPGEVTRIVARWAPTDMPATGPGAPVVGTNYYDDFPNGGFDPTVLEGPVGYVWHCHIIDHEDNEMMRNYVVGAGTIANPTGRQPISLPLP